MRNKIIVIIVIALLGYSLISEPIEDTIDLFAGATSDTYNSPDDISGPSEEVGD